MGEVIPYEVFKAKQREKKYGKPVPMAAYGYPDDFSPFKPEESFEDYGDLEDGEWTKSTT